jgi:hypothetical protein
MAILMGGEINAALQADVAYQAGISNRVRS